MNPRALAQQLGQAVKETPEYASVQSARAKVEEHEAARLMLRDFKRRQEEYRKAFVAGKAGEDEAKELRRLAEIVGYNPYIRELLAAEARLADLVLGLQNEIMVAAGLAERAAEGDLETDAKDN
ncbi:MAG: YlbF family regulator [Bacteroidota bacterium]